MGSKTSTTKQENSPPSWAEPLFTQSATDAGNLYKSGVGGNTFQGSTVAPLSGTTMSGVNQLARAGQAWDTSGTRPLYQGIGEASVGPSSASENLQGYASGEYLKGEGNPFYRQRLEREIGDSTALLNSTFSGKGRYGSISNQGTVADNASNMLLSGLESDFNRQTENQFNAVDRLDQQRNLGLDRAFNVTNSMAGQDQQQFANQLTGAGATLQAGGILDEQKQKQLADQVAKWYANDNQDWTRLGMLQSAAAGAAGPYGSQVATSRQPMDIGGILSGFGSLAKKSDIRLKYHIIPLGLHEGVPLYEFSYRGHPARFIGVMAQDILALMPDAVLFEDDGFMAVDYRKLGFPMTRIH